MDKYIKVNPPLKTMDKYIKVNLPRTLEDFVKGNGEGVWVKVDEKTKADYDNDVAGVGYVGILANDSLYFPGLYCGAVLQFEMRGRNRPVADFDGFLSKLSGISDEEKDVLIQHIMESHPEMVVEYQERESDSGNEEN